VRQHVDQAGGRSASILALRAPGARGFRGIKPLACARFLFHVPLRLAPAAQRPSAPVPPPGRTPDLEHRHAISTRLRHRRAFYRLDTPPPHLAGTRRNRHRAGRDPGSCPSRCARARPANYASWPAN